MGEKLTPNFLFEKKLGVLLTFLTMQIGRLTYFHFSNYTNCHISLGEHLLQGSL